VFAFGTVVIAFGTVVIEVGTVSGDGFYLK